MERRIIHIDMDAFFASIEQRDNPDLRGKPIIVGFDGPRGVVSTASYEARKYGVHSAMSVVKAKKLCPDLTIVATNHAHYKEVSMQVYDIFCAFTDKIEPLSIDEAFLDVTESETDRSPEDIAMAIKDRIRNELCLTASAGISYNKFLAKIASDYNKPDGMFSVSSEEALDFLAELPIEKFWGVGPKTASMMHKMGIFNGLQLRQCTMNHLTDVFGKAGEMYYNFARGIDDRPVEPVRIRKSVGCEQTFLTDLNRKSAIYIELYHIVLELMERLNKSKFCGHTLTLKVKFHDFVQVTRSMTSIKPLDSKDTILPLAKTLMEQVDYSSKPVRLIGLSVSNPHNERQRPEWVEGTLKFKDWEDFTTK